MIKNYSLYKRYVDGDVSYYLGRVVGNYYSLWAVGSYNGSRLLDYYISQFLNGER